uniref:Uncharacterized protein n=1 Tax=Anopheles culicifacies TaxID=139723 RepID=A0A182MHE6_9DIPT
MAESKQTPLSEPEVPKREGGSVSPYVQPAASPADTAKHTTDKGQDRSSCSPTRELAGEEKNEAKLTLKQEVEITEHEITPKSEPDPTSPEKSVQATPEVTPATPRESAGLKQEIVEDEEEVTQNEEVETKEATSPVAMEIQPVVEHGVGNDGDDGNEKRTTSQPSRSVGVSETDNETGVSDPEVQAISAESLNRQEETKPSSPSAQPSPTENVHEKVMSKVELQNGGEEGSRQESLLLPPPPPPPPLPRVEKEVARTVGKVSIVAPILERPDSARLTADLQSCQRQLAEVRSKYDVTRKELHATKRKLKRMSVRLGNMTGGTGTAQSGAIVGNTSPHPLSVGTADEDRNRKWREPMIVAAMKIKTAMGIQAYKSLIKDGELLLPSLRTITRYLESLRKSGGGAAAAAAVLANAGAGAKVTAPIEVDDVPEEEDEDDEEEMEDVVAIRADGVLQRRLEHTGGKKKQTKANGGGGTGRTVDHNRNEQRRHPSYNSHQQQYRHHAPDVQLQDIKTEQDPVSFTGYRGVLGGSTQRLCSPVASGSEVSALLACLATKGHSTAVTSMFVPLPMAIRAMLNEKRPNLRLEN